MTNTLPEIQTGNAVIAVLTVSREVTDHEVLRQILPEPNWKVYSAMDARSAVRRLRQRTDISLMVCDREFWRLLLTSLSVREVPPVVVVAASDADERLWAEVLNHGAYDLLAKPFEPAEVRRCLRLAWLHRQRNVPPRGLEMSEVQT